MASEAELRCGACSANPSTRTPPLLAIVKWDPDHSAPPPHHVREWEVWPVARESVDEQRRYKTPLAGGAEMRYKVFGVSTNERQHRVVYLAEEPRDSRGRLSGVELVCPRCRTRRRVSRKRAIQTAHQALVDAGYGNGAVVLV